MDELLGKADAYTRVRACDFLKELLRDFLDDDFEKFSEALQGERDAEALAILARMRVEMAQFETKLKTRLKM